MPPYKPTVPIYPDALQRTLEPIVDVLRGGTVATDGAELRPTPLERRLIDAGNPVPDVLRLRRMLGMAEVVLEIGCGDADLARRIAEGNPRTGVIATDAYPWETGSVCGSRYREVALAWKEGRLAAQRTPPTNLATLRADIGILEDLPARSVDALLLIHPEPLVGQAVLGRLAAEGLRRALKPGPRAIVVLPYSREMGVYACGGCEFDHAPDWSRGLGFLMSSPFRFARGDRVQWGVDLPLTSRYTRNSTQSDVYVAAV